MGSLSLSDLHLGALHEAGEADSALCALLQVFAGASLMTALKLRNMARQIQDIAMAMIYAAIELLADVRYGANQEPKATNRKVYSTELWIAFAATKVALTCAPTKELARAPYEVPFV
jgi:hypothetical protein